MDLYVCERVGNSWGKPRNLGPKINTARNEIFPFVHADGTLFYSSDGLKGNGGLDIFYATWNAADFGQKASKSSFSAPVNLGEPFNSDKDDFGFIVDLDMKNGYFTSNKQGGIGGDDIYSFNIDEGTLFDNINPEIVSNNTSTLEKPTTTAPNNIPNKTPTKNNASKNTKTTYHAINLLVVDRQTGKPIADATAGFLNLNELSILDIVVNEKGKQTPFVKPDGSFALELVATKMTDNQTDKGGKTQIKTEKDGNYVISVKKKGYLTEQMTLKKGDTRSEIVVLLDRFTSSRHPSPTPKDFTFQEGISLKLNNVYYNFNDGSIRPDAAKDLDVLYQVMTKYPDIEIELGSYTDARGTSAFNLDLSQRRAESAVQYLVNRGIDPLRIIAKGYGETRLRNQCSDGVPCSESEHKLNRRTEVKITKIGSAQGVINTDFFTEETEK